MGTRADFYIGRGKDAKWIGSIAMDGYPDGIPDAILEAPFEEEFKVQVASHIDKCGHGTKVEQGWPWPWDDSRTTDYAYAFDGGKVWASGFGHSWFDPLKKEPEDSGEKVAVFPDMKAVQKVTMGPRSGLLVFNVRKGD